VNINKEWAIPAAVGVVSFGVGAAVGYILSTRSFKKVIDEGKEEIERLESEQLELDFKRAELDKEFNKQIQQSILVIRELKEEGQIFLKKFSVGEMDETEKSSSDPEPDPVPEPQVIQPESEPEPEEPEPEEESSINYTIESNVRKEEIMSVGETLAKAFANPANDGWNWDEELMKRGNKTRPYVIHRDEYYNKEEPYYSQDTLTYYAGDDILTDSNDVPLYDAKYIVGDLEFGRGSGDPNVCYVRNDRLQAEYEVLCEHGTFGTMILGDHVQDLIKKSKIRHSLDKFRDDD
jgi:hypothetical protein